MVNTHKLGLTVGSFAGLAHLVWSLLVFLGWAEPLLDFILRMHFVSDAHTIAAFSWGRALGLIVLASAVGYIAGKVMGALWNKVNK